MTSTEDAVYAAKLVRDGKLAPWALSDETILALCIEVLRRNEYFVHYKRDQRDKYLEHYWHMRDVPQEPDAEHTADGIAQRLKEYFRRRRDDESK